MCWTTPAVPDACYIIEPCKFTGFFTFHVSLRCIVFDKFHEIYINIIYQKIGYDKAAAVAKKAHKEGTTLKVKLATIC